MMLGEILTISFEQTRNVLLTDIDSSPHLFGFTGLQSVDAEIGVQACDEALEQILVGLPRGR
jgi:hypothetical protein